MSASNDQCAIGPDGKLLDAKDIVWYNDADDVTPLPPPGSSVPFNNVNEGRGKRNKKVARLISSLAAEKQDDDGNNVNISHRRIPRLAQARQQTGKATSVETDVEMEDSVYEVSSGSEDSSESDFNVNDMVVTNDEIASILPSKTNPQSSAALIKARSKRKSLNPSATASVSKKLRSASVEEVQDDTVHVRNTPSSIILNEAPPNLQPVKKTESCSSLMDGKKNYIYLFYEPVNSDADGSVLPAAKYYRCFHGNRATFKVTKGMKHSTKNMVTHLRANFPSMYKLYLSFGQRDTVPTLFEVNIASASPDICDDEIREHLSALEESCQSTIQSAFEKQVSASWDQSKFESLLIEWIVAHDQPFEEVERPAFRDMLNYVHMASRKPLKIPGRTTIKKKIMEMGQEAVKSTQDMFASLKSKVSISLDAWTSSNQYAFLATVAHYVSNDGNLEELLIDFKELLGDHSGENMAANVWETLELYGITRKISAFVMDNATNNDTMLVALQGRFHAVGIEFSASDSRRRCMPHTIHLSALSLLEESGAISSADAEKALSIINYQDIATESLESSDEDAAFKDDEQEDTASPKDVNASAVGRLRKIVRAIRSSPQRRQSWSRIVQVTQPESLSSTCPRPLIPILDVRTRWSSTHQMLQRAIKYQSSINQFVTSTKELHIYELSESDWVDLCSICDWLQIFRAATTQMSATKTPMLSTTHAIFHGLQDKLKDILRSLPDDGNAKIKSGIIKAHQKLSDYFHKFDISPFYTWAAILDPRITYDDLHADYQDDADLLSALEKSKTSLYEYYNKFYANLAKSPALSSHVTQPRNSSNSGQLDQYDFTARFRHKSQQQVINELDEYLRLPAQEFHSCNPIQWWYSQRSRFPSLHRLAFDILAIPGSAVAVERIFSGGRDTISLRRASLRPETIRILMLLKQAIRYRAIRR